MMYQKPKDVAKIVLPKGPTLTKKVLSVMDQVAGIVGSTLGPGGSTVLIERQEVNMPSILTKDGVTVFRSLSMEDPVQHEVMAAARDAAVRTADSAGDGTTTATILANAIVQRTHDYLAKNPTARPQGIVRELEKAFGTIISPALEKASVPVNIATEEGRKIAHAVAKVSANGDEPLADSVLEAFDVVGDDGNVTLVEASGPSSYAVEPIAGYPVASGYEDSADRFMTVFINDHANQRVYMEKPYFLLYYGRLTDPNQIIPFLEAVGSEWEESGRSEYGNIVLAATGFSDSVLGLLASNWSLLQTINVYPLMIPLTIESEGTMKILQDLSAYTGASLFSPGIYPLDLGSVADLGKPMEYFEARRTRSTIVGEGDPERIMARAEELRVQAENAVSILDKSYIEERIGKLTGGIAKLIIYGSSAGEVREKRDRAEDAIMAVRGAIKHGVLPAGGRGLLAARKALLDAYAGEHAPIIEEILLPALMAPLVRLLSNVGLNEEEVKEVILKLQEDEDVLYDVWSGTYVSVSDAYLYDSLPAVREAIRNSLSIASLLGTLGGVVAFKRDRQVELEEALANLEFLRDANTDPTTYVSEADLRI